MAGVATGYWQDLATTDFDNLDVEHTVALLPVAAIEQHGPHLPLSTDAAINHGVVNGLLAAPPSDVTVLVLPTLPIGDSIEHTRYPGTLSLSPDLLIQMWSEIGASVAAAGIRKLVIFNSHGGQPQIVDIVAKQLRIRHEMLVVKVHSFRLGLPEGMFGDDERRFGIHAGAIETSILMHLHPELVRQDEIADFPSAAASMPARFGRLAPGGPVSFGWATQDLNSSGACGDARKASAERGAKILAHLIEGLSAAVRDTARFPLTDLKP